MDAGDHDERTGIAARALRVDLAAAHVELLGVRRARGARRGAACMIREWYVDACRASGRRRGARRGALPERAGSRRTGHASRLLRGAPAAGAARRRRALRSTARACAAALCGCPCATARSSASSATTRRSAGTARPAAGPIARRARRRAGTWSRHCCRRRDARRAWAIARAATPGRHAWCSSRAGSARRRRRSSSAPRSSGARCTRSTSGA